MQNLLPLAFFAFVTTITPGPNNIMLASSGIWFGFVRSIPHMLGISFGFTLLLAACAAGIGSLVMAVPSAQFLLKVAGSGYLLYLAWKLRNMPLTPAGAVAARPMSFRGAAMFQFANPKAWVIGITGASGFLPLLQPIWWAIAVYCLVFCVVGLPCIGVWAGAGAMLRRCLRHALWRRIFSAVMVLLTLYSAWAIWR
ncbi:MAG: lysine transporter LysE [Herbaspirillum sp.]|nr:lysine transporter LysE [Herbaspirillum sp.]